MAETSCPAALEFPEFYTPFTTSGLSKKDRERLAQPLMSRIPQYDRRAVKTRADQAAQAGKRHEAFHDLIREIHEKEMPPPVPLNTVVLPSESYIEEQARLADATTITRSQQTRCDRTTPCLPRKQSSTALESSPREKGQLLTLGREGRSLPTATDHFQEVGSIFQDMARWENLPGNNTLSKAQMVFCRGDRIYATIFLLLALASIVLAMHVVVKMV